MNDKQLVGLPVVTLSDGETLGRVERAYLDPTAKRIVGIAYAASGGFLQPESSPMVDVSDIEALSTDGLVLVDASAVRGRETIARYVDLIDLTELHGRRVLTEGGTSLGNIVAASFDESAFTLTELEIGAGFFANHTKLPAEQIVTIGDDVVVVSDAVTSGEGAMSGIASTTEAAPDRQPFQEETFEIAMRRQEIVVEKRVRIAEEIVISREASERAEQVGDTVRRERVHLTEREIADTSSTGPAGIDGA